MRWKTLLPAILAMLPILFTGTLGAIEPATLSPNLLRTLPRGTEIYKDLERKGDSLGVVTVAGYIDATPQQVYKALTNPNLVTTLFPSVKKNEQRSRKGDLYVFYSELAFPWPMEDRWSLNETRFFPEMHAIQWNRVDGTIKTNQGAWRLFPRGNKTLMIYRVRFDPGLSLVPAWLVEYGMKTEAPSIIRNVQNYFANQS